MENIESPLLHPEMSKAEYAALYHAYLQTITAIAIISKSPTFPLGEKDPRLLKYRGEDLGQAVQAFLTFAKIGESFNVEISQVEKPVSEENNKNSQSTEASKEHTE